MNHLSKRISTLLLFLTFFSSALFSEEHRPIKKKGTFQPGLELNTKYVWRGTPFGNAPVLFPSLSFDYGALNVMAFGGYALNGSHAEVDWFVSYSKNGWMVGLGDYFFPDDTQLKGHYLNYRSASSPHLFELFATYQPSFVPLTLTVSSFIYGNDRNAQGRNYYSSYVELAYQHSVGKDHSLTLLCGVTPFKGFYAERAALVNIALKYDASFSFNSYRLPLSGSFIINPYTEQAYLSFSIYLK